MTANNPIRATDNGSAAATYHAEQLWEASRGLVDAYLVDVGGDDQLDPLPTWRSLSTEQQAEWFAIVKAIASPLSTMAAQIAKAVR